MKHQNSGGRARVLIVDPEFRLGLTLADSLATSGYHPVLVRHLASVLNEIDEIRPEAILLGPNAQPQATPTDGCEELRLARQACPTIPVITISASGELCRDGKHGLPASAGESVQSAERLRARRITPHIGSVSPIVLSH